MKHPIITSIGLAVLASISLVTPALATISIDYVRVQCRFRRSSGPQQSP